MHTYTHTHTTWDTPLTPKMVGKSVKDKLGQSWSQDMEGGINPLKCSPLHVGPQHTERISGWLGRSAEEEGPLKWVKGLTNETSPSGSCVRT